MKNDKRMMQETKTSEPNKSPVETAPQQTYTHTFEGFFRLSWVVAEVLEGICLCAAESIWGLGGWKAILILFLILSLPVLGLVLSNRKKHGFITISPEGLTCGGALNFKDGFKRDFTQEDFDKVSHFAWEEIRHVDFTRDLSNPSFLFVELNDGETYYFPLLYFYNKIIIIDNLRRFTGYSGCKDLGRYVPYVRRLRSEGVSSQD
jgi:hypothetical protein